MRRPPPTRGRANAVVLPGRRLLGWWPPSLCAVGALPAFRELEGWGRPTGLELADVGDVDDGRALLVRGGEVDRGGDAPVVIAGRVVEDLADRPGGLALLDEQPRR